MTGDPIDRTIVQPAAEAAAPSSRRWTYVLAAMFLLSLAALAAVLFSQHQEIGALSTDLGKLQDSSVQTANQSNQNATDAQALKDQVLRLGGTPVVEPAKPAAVPAPVAGPGPTQAQIDDAVAAQLAAHPPAAGQSATPAMVATAVADYLTVNPPAPGRPPTAAEISTAASSYISTHAADFQGPGGAAGQSATDAQVAASVAAYCDAHNSCAGGTGAQGVSVTDVAFQRDDTGTCEVVVALHDPGTGVDTTATHPAGDAACPLVPPTTDPPATPQRKGS